MIVYKTIFAISLAGQYEIYDNNHRWDNYKYCTTPVIDCQQEYYKSTMEYNYITTEQYIQNNINKYQDIIP